MDLVSDPSKESVQFIFAIEKWDAQSNAYRDAGENAIRSAASVSKLLLVDNAQYADVNAFCKFMTERQPELRGEVYPYGAWTSKNTPVAPENPGGTGPTGPTEGAPADVP